MALDIANIRVTIDGDATSAVAAGDAAQASFNATAASGDAMSASLSATFARVSEAYGGLASSAGTSSAAVSASGQEATVAAGETEALAASLLAAASAADQLAAAQATAVAGSDAIASASGSAATAMAGLQTEIAAVQGSLDDMLAASTAAGVGLTALGTGTAAYADAAALAAEADAAWAQTLADIAVAQALVEEATLQVTAAEQIQIETMAEAATGAEALAAAQGDLASSGEAATASAGGLNGGIVGLGLAVGVTAVAATALGVSFEASMNKLVAMAGVPQSQIAQLTQQVLDLSKATGASPDELAQELYLIKSSGLDASSSMDVLGVSTRLALAAQTDAAPVAALLTSALRAYGQSAADASHDADILAATTVAGKLQFGDLADSMGRTLPIAANFGIGLDQLGASIATMTQKGLSADEATTAVRSVIQALEEPTTATTKALGEMGLSVADVRSEISEKGLLATLDDLIGRANSLGIPLKDLIPNVRGLTGALADVGSSGGQDYLQALNSIDAANGQAAASFISFQTTTKASLEEFKSNVEVDLIQGFDAAEPHIASGLAAMSAEWQQFSGHVTDAAGAVATSMAAANQGSGSSSTISLGGQLGALNPFLDATNVMDAYNTAMSATGPNAQTAAAGVHILADEVALIPALGQAASQRINDLSNTIDDSGQRAKTNKAAIDDYVKSLQGIETALNQSGGSNAVADYLQTQYDVLKQEAFYVENARDATDKGTASWKLYNDAATQYGGEIDKLQPQIDALSAAEQKSVLSAAAHLDLFGRMAQAIPGVTSATSIETQALNNATAGMNQAGLAEQARVAALADIDSKTKASAASTDVAAANFIAYNEALAAVNGGASTLAVEQDRLNTVIKDGTPAQKAQAQAVLDYLTDLGALSPQQIAAAEAQDQLNLSVSNSHAIMQTAIGDAINLKNVFQDLATAENTITSKPSPQELQLNAQVAGNQSTIANWNAQISSSSPIDQTIAALQKQLDTETQTGASASQIADTTRRLNEQLAAVPDAEGQAIVQGQHYIDNLNQQTAALQASSSALAANRALLGANTAASNAPAYGSPAVNKFEGNGASSPAPNISVNVSGGSGGPSGYQDVAQAAGGPGDPSAFVDSVWGVASAFAAQYGGTPQEWIAINASESNYGNTPNNAALFGIKGDGGPLDYVSSTWEQGANGPYTTTASFKGYSSVGAAYQDFLNWTAQNFPDAYNEFMQDHDFEKFIQNLNAGGYATNSHWWSDIESLAPNIAALYTGTGGGTPAAGSGSAPTFNNATNSFGAPAAGSTPASGSVPAGTYNNATQSWQAKATHQPGGATAPGTPSAPVTLPGGFGTPGQLPVPDDGTPKVNTSTDPALADATAAIANAQSAANPDATNALTDQAMLGLNAGQGVDWLMNLLFPSGGVLDAKQSAIIAQTAQSILAKLESELKAGQIDQGQFDAAASVLTQVLNQGAPQLSAGASYTQATSAASAAGSAAQKGVSDAQTKKGSGNADQIGRAAGIDFLSGDYNGAYNLLLSDPLEVGAVVNAAIQYIQQNAATAQQGIDAMNAVTSVTSTVQQHDAPGLAALDPNAQSNMDRNYSAIKATGKGAVDINAAATSVANFIMRGDQGDALKILMQNPDDAQAIADAALGIIQAKLLNNQSALTAAQNLLSGALDQAGSNQYALQKHAGDNPQAADFTAQTNAENAYTGDVSALQTNQNAYDQLSTASNQAAASGNSSFVQAADPILAQLAAAINAGTLTVHGDLLTLNQTTAKTSVDIAENLAKARQENADWLKNISEEHIPGWGAPQAPAAAGGPPSDSAPGASVTWNPAWGGTADAEMYAESVAAQQLRAQNQQLAHIGEYLDTISINTQRLVDAQGNAAMYLDGGRIASMVGAGLVGRVTLLAGGGR